MKPLSFAAALLLAAHLPAPVLRGAAPDAEARLATLEKLVRDDSPKVRLEALRALARIPAARSAELALSVLDQPMDPTLDYGLWLTINDLAEPWIAALQAGLWKPEGREKQLEFALKALRPEQAGRVLAQVLASRPLTREGTGPWIELIGTAGTPRELQLLLDQVLGDRFDTPAATRALKALAEASRLRKAQPAGDLSSLARLFDHPAASLRVEAIRLAGQWKAPGPTLARLASLAGAADTDPAVRTAAFEALRTTGGPEATQALATLAAADRPPAVRHPAVTLLASLDLGQAVPRVVETLRGLDDEAAALAFWRGVLPVKGSGAAIARALPAGGLPAAAARAGMRAAREGGRSDLDLITALARASGQAADTQAFTTQLVRELAAAAGQGDPARGEGIYRRDSLGCVLCHAIGGAGGRVGPDMTSIGASAPVDYLVESVLLPNAKIKEGYHSLVVTTRDNSEYLGTLARETPEELVLRNAAGVEQPIAKADITRREQGVTSLMPAGLLESLNSQEQLDLFAFLSRLGKPGDYDASQGGVARRWRLAQTVHTDAQAGQESWPVTAPWSDQRWVPTYSLVRGNLTRAVMEEATRAQFWTGKLAVYAVTELTVAKAGPVALQLTANPAAELWIGPRKVGGAGSSRPELAAGTHRVLVKLDPKQIPESIRLESPDASFLLN